MSGPKIIVAIDFSAGSKAALELAASVARDRKATLLVVHVREMPSANSADPLFPRSLAPDEAFLDQLQKVAPDSLGVPITRQVLQGDPADTICELAEKEHADLIVMGTHGRRGILRLLMGSVAELVVRRAQCPVLVVKQAAPA